jgi:hypothetical protein
MLAELTDKIQAAIDEFAPLYDEVTTSDLQGICEARAMQITKGFHTQMEVADKILQGIYGRVSC